MDEQRPASFLIFGTNNWQYFIVLPANWKFYRQTTAWPENSFRFELGIRLSAHFFYAMLDLRHVLLQANKHMHIFVIVALIRARWKVLALSSLLLIRIFKYFRSVALSWTYCFSSGNFLPNGLHYQTFKSISLRRTYQKRLKSPFLTPQMVSTDYIWPSIIHSYIVHPALSEFL